MAGWITLGILLLLLLCCGIYTVIIYNGFVALKNNINQDWSNIDVLLKQRFDELPKLIKVCEGYMQHEQKTLEAVVKARSQVNAAQNRQPENAGPGDADRNPQVAVHGWSNATPT